MSRKDFEFLLDLLVTIIKVEISRLDKTYANFDSDKFLNALIEKLERI